MTGLLSSWLSRSLVPVILLVIVQVAEAGDPAKHVQPLADMPDLSIVAAKHRIREAELRLEQLQLSVDRERASLARAKDEDTVRLAIYGRQLWYHPLILLSVIAIVATGVLLSYLQVKRDLIAGSAQESSLELTRDGLRVRSPVIGLLILIVSLGFFYLYLREVYRITEATGSVGAPATLSPGVGQTSTGIQTTSP